MKKNTILLFLVLISVFTFAQNSYKKGYVITNSGEKIECLIKDLDLLNNPTQVTYQLPNSDKKITNTIKDIKAYEIYEVAKYERHSVAIDKSINSGNEISNNRKPEFNTETLFLRVIIAGKATLYKYVNPNFFRYFYKNENSDITQLVYKVYYKPDGNSLAKNERYKQQLLNNLKCKDFKKSKFKNLEYRERSLTNFFEAYNNCVGAKFINYKEKKDKKSAINLNLRVGANSLSYQIFNNTRTSFDFDKKIALRIGFEAEYVLGFNNNKWAFIIEPNYLYYNSFYNDTTERITEADNSASINYSAINLPVGFRHYMYLNNKSKFFINAQIVPNLTIKSEIRSLNEVVNRRADFDGESDLNYAFGFGYKYNNKFSVELRTHSQRDLVNQFVTIESSFNSTSLILGYTLF